MNKKIVHSVFEHIAAAFPDHQAVEESNGASITYRDLNRQANIIGSLLAERGIKRDRPAGILLPTGIAYSATLMGVLKTGGLFMPLELTLPRPRLLQILSHTSPAIMVTNEASAAELQEVVEASGLAESTRVLVIDGQPDAGSRGMSFVDLVYTDGRWQRSPAVVFSDGSNLPLISEPDDSCYVIYTSGSTGVPKFIEGRHKGLAHYCHWQAAEFGLNQTSKISQMAPVTFEASLKDFFVAFCCGATLCIPAAEVKENPARLIEWIESSELTLFQTVPSYLRLVSREAAAPDGKSRFPALKLVFSSGDTLYGKDVNQWRQAIGDHVELVNLYGPAEVTLLKSFHRIPAGELKPNEIVLIGKPISNTAILILNGDTLCPPGKIGEICVKSPFIAKGYYRSPELTAERFVQNPLNPETRDIIYRTGDLGRYRPDLTIEFIGRRDNQVKVHGNRIELAEIENVLLSFPKINQVVVIPHQTAEMENVLVCYYTEQEPVTRAELRELILSRLPDYMMPAYFIKMGQLPLNLNGKVNRRALPKPEELVIASYDQPATATEKRLAKIWSEVLGLGRVGAGNPFIEIGGDSLKAIRIITRIYKAFGVEVSVRDFFSLPTIRELARFVDSGRKTPYLKIPTLPTAESYELSPAQRRLWILDQMEKDASVYNIAASFLIEGTFNPDAFIRALEVMHQRHESLRTTFISVDGLPRQRVSHESRPLVFIEDLSASIDPEPFARERFQAEASRPFDLGKGPLYRISLLTLAEERTVFIFVIHHIISDVWSLEVMTSELSGLYNGFIAGQAPELPLLPIQYRDFAAWQNHLLASSERQTDRAYWLEKLAGPLPLLDLPADHPRPRVKTYQGGTVRCLLGEKLSRGLTELSAGRGVSLFALLLTLVRVLVFRYTGQEDLVIGTPIAGRIHPDLEGQIGFFVNTLALREQVSASERFGDLLARQMAANTTAFDHQNYPFDRLVEELKIPRDVSRSPVFDLMVMLQNTEQATFDLAGATVREFDRFETVSKFDLSFIFSEQVGKIEMLLEYNVDLFDRTTIERLRGHLEQLMRSVIENPDLLISRLELLPPHERQQILIDWNETAAPLPEVCAHQLFEAWVERTPEATAMVFEDERLTYAALNARANQLAHTLIALGISSEEPVAISLPRSPALVIALLGVLKAGGAYVPLDPDYPAERLAFMLADSEAKILITQENLRHRLPQFAEKILCLDTDGPFIAQKPESNPDRLIAPKQLAYIIYTSGSTGKPKGVAVTHLGLSNLSQEQINSFELTPESRVWQFAPFSFDASVWETIMALCAGGALYLPNAEQRLPGPTLLRYLDEAAITHLTLPPTALAALPQMSLPKLEVLIVAGEPCPPALAVFWSMGRRFFNAYGPTETTVCAALAECPQAAIDGATPLPIGRPIANTQLFLLDEQMQPLPIGVAGELHVGGIGLARGYLNRPELTAERFIPNPFSTEPGSRLYKTGDLCRYRPDGAIEFLCRIDNQVKIRGFRLELGEIEAALARHPEVREAVVMAREDQPGDKRLAAYIVPIKESGPTVMELSDHLKTILPDYMIPSTFVTLDSFPLTPNGKIDRKALPDPLSSSVTGLKPGTEYIPPRNELEQIVAQVWEGVLGRGRIGIHDNYFALGGDSIRAIQIGSRLLQEGLKLQHLDIFQYPTVAGLAGRVTKLKRISDQGLVVGPVPLTPVQRWFFEEHQKGLHHFNQSILLGSSQRLDEQGLSTLFAALLSHHDALRLHFTPGDSGWKQENLTDGLRPGFAVLDLTGEPEPYAALERHVASQQAGFDLAVAPLAAVVLYRLPDGDRLLIIIHHLVVDGVSWRILAEDLLNGYARLKAGEPLTFPRKSDSFKLWSERLLEYASAEALLKEKAYWQTLARAEATLLPLGTAQERPRGSAVDFDQIQFGLAQDETNQLLTRAIQTYHLEPVDLLLTALAYSLQDWTGARRHLITLEGHGREDIGAELDITRTVGWFTSLFPHLLELPERDDPGYRLRVVKEGLRAVPNHGLGYGVLRWLTPDALKGGLDLPPLPRLSFNYLGTFDNDFGSGPFFPADEPHGENVGAEFTAAFDLEYTCSVMGGTFSLHLRYDRRLLLAEEAQRLAGGFMGHLRGLMAHCCQQEESVISPSDISYDGLTIDQLDSLLEGLNA
ncbi:MAG: amino acid adenylation domain-containing protein [Pseudomonadota bacterium]